MVTELKGAAFYLATSSDRNPTLAWVWKVTPGETVEADFVVAVDAAGSVLGYLSATPPFEQLLIGEGKWFRFGGDFTPGSLSSCLAAESFKLTGHQRKILGGKRVCVSIQSPLDGENYAGQ